MLFPKNRVKALYQHSKTNEEDLEFHKDDLLTIIKHTSDDQWALAKNSNGETGLIPLNFVESANDPSWLHFTQTRSETEGLLSERPPGSFLVRISNQFAGDFTLSLKKNVSDTPKLEFTNDESDLAPIQHYHIHTVICNTETGPSKFYTLDEEQVFPSLRKLVEFYSTKDKGLAFDLLYPVTDQNRDRLAFLRDNYWIERDSITLGPKLGQGDFGEVLKGKYNNCDVALKIYQASNKLHLFYEACLMTHLKHHNLLRIIGVTVDKGEERAYLVTEYLANGCLLSYLRSRGRALIGQALLLSIVMDVAKGLVFLEENCFLHCDIAARNVLLSDVKPFPVAKLGDFGLARHVAKSALDGGGSGGGEEGNKGISLSTDSSGLMNKSVQSSFSAEQSTGATFMAKMARIPLKWTAPETIRNRTFSHKSDVWSFGILLWEVYSYGRLPYPKLMTNHVLEFLEAGKRMPSPEGCPFVVYAIMTETWRGNPSSRPCFSEILTKLQTFAKQNSLFYELQSVKSLSLPVPIYPNSTN